MSASAPARRDRHGPPAGPDAACRGPAAGPPRPLGRATYRAHGIRHEVDMVDELAEREGRDTAAWGPDAG